MRLFNMWKPGILLLIALLVGLAACGGGGDGLPAGGNLGGGGNPPAVVGDITAPPAPGDFPAAAPVAGILPDAPLGTVPEYEVQEAAETIVTRPVSGVSSIGKGTSQGEDPLFWVAVIERDGTPVAGQASGTYYEGDEVDLYMRYQVDANQLTISREWYLAAAGLHLIEPEVTHPEPGAYEAIFPFTLRYGSAALDAVFIGVWGLPRTTSAFVIPDMGDFREATFDILETPTLAPIVYPPEEPPLNDEDGCMPEWITVDWTSDTEVYVESESELSNVVLEFEDGEHEKWDDLVDDPTRVYDGSFWGTGANDGKTIVTVWVKSGCNASGDGPGYGEMFEPVTSNELAMAQLAWEDLITNSDYDYNDFVGRMRAVEYRNENNELVQVQLVIKALARAAGYDSDWQFNVNGSFPTVSDVDVIAIVDQFYADGTRHGFQRVYTSAGGMSVPVFTPIRTALPNPPGSYATNGVPGTQFMDGDYAEVTIILNKPLAQGSYTPIPYEPELRVQPTNGDVYTIGIWKEIGDDVDSSGRPLAFIVPDTYAWPLEGRAVWTCFDGYEYWIQYINDPNTDEPLLAWWDENPVADLVFSRDKFTPWPVD